MILDDLTFIKPVGKGSFGQVYLTSKAGQDVYYATKIIKKSLADSAKIKKYFHNEIKILKEVKHKNIMELIEIKQNTENYYLICEFCNGGSLYQCLHKYIKMYNKPFSEEITQYLMRQIIEALKYLHGNHIMHRDLKLDNILLNFKDLNDKSILNMYGAEVKIIDFGFAAHVDNKSDLHKSVLGSPMFMDPKILKKYTRMGTIDSTGYDEKIDIWSLGNICYQMLLGRAAFETKDIKILAQKIEKGFYSLPTTFYKEVVGFLIGMLQYDSNIRLSAEELSKHDFLCKNIRKFTRIDIIKMKRYIKDNKLIISVKEDRNLWNIFNNKYNNRFLEIIPEDTEVSESVIGNNISHNMKRNYSINVSDNFRRTFSINNTHNFSIKSSYNERNNNDNNNKSDNIKKIENNHHDNKNNVNKNNNINKNNINKNNKSNNKKNLNNNSKNIYLKNNSINNSLNNNNKINNLNNNNNIKDNTNKNNNINNKNNNNNINKNDISDTVKEKLRKAFDKINEDFFYMPPIFIPLIPGNDPNDRFNGEKQI